MRIVKSKTGLFVVIKDEFFPAECGIVTRVTSCYIVLAKLAHMDVPVAVGTGSAGSRKLSNFGSR